MRRTITKDGSVEEVILHIKSQHLDSSTPTDGHHMLIAELQSQPISQPSTHTHTHEPRRRRHQEAHGRK